MTIRRTLLAALAATALIAPAAQAQPADMHASTAQAAAKAQHQPKQDLRSPDARDAAVPVVHSQDLRSPDTRDAALERPGGGAPAPSRTAWPSAAWSVPSPQPAAAASADDGIEWSTLLLGIGGALLLAGGLAFTATRGSRRRVAV